MINNRFFGRRRPEPPRPIPPGQYLEDGFPVLSAGPTPRVDTATWEFTIQSSSANGSEGGSETLGSWDWDALNALPQTDFHTDIHCVTKWSKLDTDWRGVTIDTLFEDAGITDPDDFVMAFCDGGYTTNLPVEDIVDGKGLLAHTYDGEPLAPEHGGPVRLLVPHLYFWKSAKWVRGLKFMDQDAPGFWEGYGYNMYGDPWREQRYTGD
ncbi:MAG: sulfite oxidase-like oxidoreductase [Chloroflexi bacterium]|nr:sulfite oxidase-like oxidoreductase [Chloroflexota bacterium]MCH8114622.1 sulfite oxidase-like oxidoreductase [Chloroflexota bacterium]MCI0775795.1 sulfite oxidase-like oxidoreductase [Chloroflexota bacterium]MCI0803303.1 sulfite oxidase-like oxidoreductase [Chloroflexota bacterium]MCI0808295.1 sulfite oxidase-like oxidoreductase [Chloroflexota bacterium]